MKERTVKKQDDAASETPSMDLSEAEDQVLSINPVSM